VFVPTRILLAVEEVINPIPSFFVEKMGDGIKLKSRSEKVRVFLAILLFMLFAKVIVISY